MYALVCCGEGVIGGHNGLGIAAGDLDGAGVAGVGGAVGVEGREREEPAAPAVTPEGPEIANEGPFANSNAVPYPLVPPLDVVPYRIPLPSMTNPAVGPFPLLPLNDLRVVTVLLSLAISKMLPSPSLPPGGAIQVVPPQTVVP